MINSDDHLDLQAWKVEVTPPTRFQAEVWQRISARASERRSFTDRLVERLVCLLPRPAWAMAFVTTSIVFGLSLGYVAGDKARSAAQENAIAHYAAGINPLAHTLDSE